MRRVVMRGILVTIVGVGSVVLVRRILRGWRLVGMRGDWFGIRGSGICVRICIHICPRTRGSIFECVYIRGMRSNDFRPMEYARF